MSLKLPLLKEDRIFLKYIKKENGEVWRLIVGKDRGWIVTKKIKNSNILAQDIIDGI